MKIQSYLTAFLDLFYPNLCPGCGNSLFAHEYTICTRCLHRLPRSYFHLGDSNPVEEIFWGRVHLVHATSFLLYQKGNVVKNYLHSIKYKGNKELGFELGKRFAQEMQKDYYYNDVSMIIPVPLHPRKLRDRGYNQSEWIGKGMAEAFQIPIDTNHLFRQKYTQTQTNKNRYDRWMNVEGVFDICDVSHFDSEHVLLVDDVVTTGATIEACASLLLKAKNVEVSVATLAYAAMS